MNDGKGLAERLLGLDGFRVLEVTETPHEVVVTSGDHGGVRGVRHRGIRTVAHEGKVVAVRDASRSVGVAQAAMALRGSRLHGQDLDRAVAGR